MNIKALIFSMLAFIMLSGSIFSWSASYAAGEDNIRELEEAEQLVERFERSIYAVYEAAVKNDKHNGYLQLQRFVQQANTWSNQPFSHNEIKQRAQWQALSKEAMKLSEQLASGVTEANWHESVSRLKLAADALTRPEKALWLQYKPLIENDIERSKLEVQSQVSSPGAVASGSLISLSNKWQRISLAASYTNNAFIIDAVNIRLEHTKKLMAEAPFSSNKKKNEMLTSLTALKAALMELFPEQNEQAVIAHIIEPTESNAVAWAMLLGALITTVLAYHAWRKYRNVPYGVKKI